MSSRFSISILGCGWLGLPLANSFIRDGVIVKGSTTSPEKLPLLEAAGIEPYLVHFSAGSAPGLLADLLNADVLIISVPPGRIPQKQENYFHLLNSLTAAIDKSSISKIIFISSTSVYGESNEKLSEKDAPKPDSVAGERMFAAEQLIASSITIPLYIVRLAGLIGPGRHPGRFFAGKTAIPNGLSPVNLIHQSDAVGIIRKLADGDAAPGIYNGCAPDHPSRQEFYTLAARKLGAVFPVFVPEKKNWKIVASEKVEGDLRYRFLVPRLIEWLEQSPNL